MHLSVDCHLLMQEAAQSIAKGLSGANVIGRLNNVLMQMRKNCNHPDLITGGLDGSVLYPSPEELRKQGGKLALLERLVGHLHKAGHKIIIFSQACSIKAAVIQAISSASDLDSSQILLSFRPH